MARTYGDPVYNRTIRIAPDVWDTFQTLVNQIPGNPTQRECIEEAIRAWCIDQAKTRQEPE